MRSGWAICVLYCMAGPAAAQEIDPRQAALGRVDALAERFALLEDKELASSLLARLGKVVCKYDVPVAASVFRKGAGTLRASGLEQTRQYEDQRGYLLSLAGSCNSDLQDEIKDATMSDGTDEARSAETALNAAQALIGRDPRRAAEVAAPAFEALPSMEIGQASYLADFLDKLRGKDSQLADRLFLETVDRFRREPAGAWAALSSLGAYVFGAASSTDVDGLEVFNWTARREGSSDDAAAAYLRAVAAKMTASAGDEQTSRFRSTVARQLQPYANTLAPELLPAFGSAVRPEDAHLDVSTLFRERGMEEALAGMAQSTDPHVRIQGQIIAWREHWMAGRFDEASAAAAGVNDEEVKANLYRLLEFGRVAAVIQEGRLEVASAMAGKLQPGFHQGMLYLSIGAAYAKKSDLESARRSLNLGWNAAGRAEAAMRPHLLIAVSGVQAAADPDVALDTLAEAVHAFNDSLPTAQAPKRRRRNQPIQAWPRGFTENIMGEGSLFYAPVIVRLSGVECIDPGTAIARFAALDLDRVDAIVAGIRDEQLLAEAEVRATAKEGF